MSTVRLVDEMSRAALNGKRGVIAVLKVYMDESGTHDQSPVACVGAWVASAKTWRDFTKEWNLKKKPIKVFHAVDCANLVEEFDGWNKDDRDNLVARILPIIPKHGLAGVVSGLNMNAFNCALKDRKDLLDLFATPYGACFHWTVAEILSIADQAGSAHRIAFFHEKNDYMEEAMFAFKMISSRSQIKDRLVSLTFGGKPDYVPLQAADALAYEGNKFLRDPEKPIKRRALTAMDPNKKNLIIQAYTKNNIGQLVKVLEGIKKRLYG